MNKIKITVQFPELPKKLTLTQVDVCGEYGKTNGMIVARYDERCPHFNDVIPYKAETVVCKNDEFDQVKYWLEYVNGIDCIQETKQLDNNRIAIRSQYMCW